LTLGFQHGFNGNRLKTNDTDIINKIEDIERQLSELRIELGRRKPFKRTGTCETGEEVAIPNPKKGQGKSGKLTGA
jgi:hypothetical protein